jgi:hypothetical protein
VIKQEKVSIHHKILIQEEKWKHMETTEREDNDFFLIDMHYRLMESFFWRRAEVENGKQCCWQSKRMGDQTVYATDLSPM